MSNRNSIKMSNKIIYLSLPVGLLLPIDEVINHLHSLDCCL